MRRCRDFSPYTLDLVLRGKYCSGKSSCLGQLQSKRLFEGVLGIEKSEITENKLCETFEKPMGKVHFGECLEEW